LWRPLGNCPVAPPKKKNPALPFMGPVGCVPSNFGHHGDQVYLPPNLCNGCRRTLCEAYSASADLLAKCLREKETRVGKEMGETWVEQ